jgi:hypothetical protein
VPPLGPALPRPLGSGLQRSRGCGDQRIFGPAEAGTYLSVGRSVGRPRAWHSLALLLYILIHTRAKELLRRFRAVYSASLLLLLTQKKKKKNVPGRPPPFHPATRHPKDQSIGECVRLPRNRAKAGQAGERPTDRPTDSCRLRREGSRSFSRASRSAAFPFRSATLESGERPTNRHSSGLGLALRRPLLESGPQVDPDLACSLSPRRV